MVPRTALDMVTTVEGGGYAENPTGAPDRKGHRERRGSLTRRTQTSMRFPRTEIRPAYRISRYPMSRTKLYSGTGSFAQVGAEAPDVAFGSRTENPQEP